MTSNTTEFIRKLTTIIDSVATCYYEESPVSAAFPYCVAGSVHISDMESGDLLAFDVDVWTDEKKPDATVELEGICDRLRNRMSNAVLTQDGVFSAHIGFEAQSAVNESEFDLCHRRLSFSARIFYIGG